MSPVTSNYTLYKRVLLMTSCSIAYVMTNHSTSDDVPIIRLYHVPSTTDQLGNSIRGGIYLELLKRHRHLSLKMNFSLPDTMAVAGPSVVTEFIAPPNTCLDCYTTQRMVDFVSFTVVIFRKLWSGANVMAFF